MLFIFTVYYIYREVYFKELAHAILGSNKTETCRDGQQVGDQAGANVTSLVPKAIWRQDSFLFGAPQSLLLRLSTV